MNLYLIVWYVSLVKSELVNWLWISYIFFVCMFSWNWPTVGSSTLRSMLNTHGRRHRTCMTVKMIWTKGSVTRLTISYYMHFQHMHSGIWVCDHWWKCFSILHFSHLIIIKSFISCHNVSLFWNLQNHNDKSEHRFSNVKFVFLIYRSIMNIWVYESMDAHK